MNYIDKKYILLMSPYLERFKDIGNDVFRCRCPYCGDSQKNKYKARGFFLEQPDTGKVIYKCHNCGISKSLRLFIQEIQNQFITGYRNERFKSLVVKERKKEISETVFKTDTATMLFEKSLLSECTPLGELNDGHVAIDYLKSRKIPKDKIDKLYFIEDVNKITSKLDKYKEKSYIKNKAIVIPFINENGLMTHIQFRFIGDVSFRFLTLELHKGHKKVYGLENVDFSKTVYVFEGPIDAMFVDNGIAIATGSLINYAYYLRKKFKDFVFVFDFDYTHNRDTLKYINKSIENNYKVVIFDDKIVNFKDTNKKSIKDVNDIILNRLVLNINTYLNKRTYSGLSAKMELNKTLRGKKNVFTKTSFL